MAMHLDMGQLRDKTADPRSLTRYRHHKLLLTLPPPPRASPPVAGQIMEQLRDKALTADARKELKAHAAIRLAKFVHL